jgi:hypothetical protein
LSKEVKRSKGDSASPERELAVRPPMADFACTREEGTVLPFYMHLTLVKAVHKSFTMTRRSMGATWRRAWGKVRRGERRRAGDRRPMA